MNREKHKLINYFIQNRPKPGTLGIFSAASWNDATGKDGFGVIIIDSNAKVFCAGPCPTDMDARIELESKALTSAFKIVREKEERCSDIYISSKELWKVIHGHEDSYHWRHSNCI